MPVSRNASSAANSQLGGSAAQIGSVVYTDLHGVRHDLTSQLRGVRKLDVGAVGKILSTPGPDTNDLCFVPSDESSSAQFFTCIIQGGTLSIGWILVPGPPSGTVATFSAVGSIGSIASQDSPNPTVAVTGPYSTTETIVLPTSATVALDYTTQINVACTNPHATVVCYPGVGGIGVQCSRENYHCPNLEIVDANLSNRVVASPAPIGTPSTAIGKPQDLSMTVEPNSGSGSYTLSTPQWTLQNFDPAAAIPTVIAGYSFSNDMASTSALQGSDLQQTTLKTFYWLTGSNGTVNSLPAGSVDNVTPNTGTTSVMASAFMTRSINGNVEEIADDTATAQYAVDAPNGLAFTATLQPAQFGPDLQGSNDIVFSKGTRLSLDAPGNTQAAVAPSYGIYWNVTGTMPTTTDGYIAVSQLYSGGYSGYNKDGTSIASLTSVPITQPQSDGCGLYTVSPVSLFSSKVPKQTAGTAIMNVSSVDAPQAGGFIDTSSYARVVSDQNFVDYAMFHPTGPRTIWVSLSKLTWNFDSTLIENGDGMLVTLPGGVSYRTAGTYSISPMELPGVTAGIQTSEYPKFTARTNALPNCTGTNPS